MAEFWEKITGSIGTGNGAGGSGPPKWFRRDNLLILVLLGVLLFIIALPVKKEEPQAASVGTETAEQYNAGIFTSPSQTTGEQETAVDTETRAVAAGSAEEYTAYLEGKLKKMLESVRGLGEVEVMITLESSEERIVEKDMTADRSQTEEQDSAGGTRTVKFFQYRIPDRLSGRQSGHTVCSEDDHTQSGGGAGGGGRSRKRQYDQ